MVNATHMSSTYAITADTTRSKEKNYIKKYLKIKFKSFIMILFYLNLGRLLWTTKKDC